MFGLPVDNELILTLVITAWICFFGLGAFQKLSKLIYGRFSSNDITSIITGFGLDFTLCFILLYHVVKGI